MLPLRKILCSTDFSEPSYAALDVAGEWAAHFDATLCVVHVVQPLEQSGLVLTRSQIEEFMQREAARQLDKVIAERVPRVKSARSIVRMGSAADEIAACARQEQADMLVIATHGSGGWRDIVSSSAVDRILFGSVATSVIRLASCPVLTVHLAPAHVK